eukprot:11742774-Ditylum_brightwellii.AAC.1
MSHKDDPIPREFRPEKGERNKKKEAFTYHEAVISLQTTISRKKEVSPGAYHLFANGNQHYKQQNKKKEKSTYHGAYYLSANGNQQQEGGIPWSLPSLHK